MAEFSRRLSEACDRHAACPDLHYGRLTWLRDEFNALTGESIKLESVRKWHTGLATPRRDKVRALAEILGVDHVWLETGSEQHKHLNNDYDVVSGSCTESARLPIRIRKNWTVEIQNLPLDLSPDEARKIANIMLAYGSAL